MVSREDLSFPGNADESGLCSEIDILSTSVVHQSVQHIDFSLKIQMPK